MGIAHGSIRILDFWFVLQPFRKFLWSQFGQQIFGALGIALCFRKGGHLWFGKLMAVIYFFYIRISVYDSIAQKLDQLIGTVSGLDKLEQSGFVFDKVHRHFAFPESRM